MRPGASLRISAAALQKATKVVISRPRKRAIPVTIRYDEREELLDLSEARHSLRECRVPAVGSWLGQVQVEGTVLRKAAFTYPPEATIELIALPDRLILAFGGSQLQLSRLDADGTPGIIKSAPKPDPMHVGPVTHPPDQPATGRFPWADTWQFSARVPFPQHRKPKKS
jgi:hypothetical protein